MIDDAASRNDVRRALENVKAELKKSITKLAESGHDDGELGRFNRVYEAYTGLSSLSGGRA